ncbi:PhzF family phenazine biosynthesis protein [Streptomyces rectiverticillatus]|uniref:PhzF family phenazine biosynthesis protein n=1 Tax=Streptomyces rectiverticillatus TaxID=173860 RepID=UPI0015C3CC19|nr:PhzF family phenazine biosynthesis protein [Streptomyces rectiverticillatus]QLE74861.1 PhzF family phenazine biosynthesis protein [Streptomyces rectiverticillatus]
MDVHVLRVFTGRPGGVAGVAGGNPLGVVTDGPAVPDTAERQRLAAELGFSETVFVDDAARGVVDIRTPSGRLAFAGHPLVGVAWLLRQHGYAADVLRPPAGDVPSWTADGATWIRARASWATGRRLQQYATPADVDALPSPLPGEGWLYAWAWQNETTGHVRARGFPRRGDGITEDEATGAAALSLTATLERDLTISQGRASVIRTRDEGAGMVSLGGRVDSAGTRTLNT